MNMISRKPKASPVDGDDVLDVLSAKLKELGVRDRVLIELQITLEKTLSSSNARTSAERSQAEALLDGEKFIASRELPISELDAVIAERKTIALALKIGGSKHHQLAA